MKGFGIYVKNDLLEPKHYANMGEALWLYLWLLDKMTSINEHGMGKVHSGKPITYEDVREDLGVSDQVYWRWIKRLKTTGYISTLRTPYGLVFTVNKAEKIFKNRTIKSNSTPSVKITKKRTIKNDTSELSKTIEPGDRELSKVIGENYQNRENLTIKNDTSNNNNTVDSTNDNTKSSKELVQAPRRGKPEINEVFEYWEQVIGFSIESQVKMNRYAAGNLVKKYGVDGVKRLIDGVNLAHSDRYAPSISDFRGLQADLSRLLVWGKKKQNVVVPKEQTAWRAKKK